AGLRGCDGPGSTSSTSRRRRPRRRARPASRPQSASGRMCPLLACSFGLLGWALCDVLERPQRAIPEPIQIAAQLIEALWVHVVDPPGPDRRVIDEARVLQHLQVLRDGGPADGQVAGKLSDGLRPLGEPLEDRSPGGITKSVERGSG